MRRLFIPVVLLAVAILPAQDEKEEQTKDFLRRARAKGGGVGTESAVEAALEWLARHQSKADDKTLGGWEVGGRKCRCRVCKNVPHPWKHRNFDSGVTGLALLAFIRHGNTHKEGKYKKTVKMAVEFLLRNQDKEGWIGRDAEMYEWTYNHAIATMALCELFATSKDKRWKRLVDACKKAVKCIVEAQNPGMGWRYEPAGGDNDTSITGWMTVALRSAERAGIAIPKCVWDGAIKWFDRCTDPSTGRVGYKGPRDSGSVIRNVNDKWVKLPAMTAVAVLCRLLCGQKRSDPKVKKSVDFLMKHLPTWDSKGFKVDMYYWYYGTYALFQYGGAQWRNWNKALKKALLDKQRRDGCAKGSWDPIGKWGMIGGRVYSTALCALMFEVYYHDTKK